ncbi:DUF4344 domain-containing metallopeptidase [Roseibium aggregatum]|uniref:Uncharacterized protein n=1 Tax=Roseibium aggregatum TaxID=187304 RepID=A0A926NXI4_9HYPH|nr:DUF4344 domain-containing metallopeptidase [Roseibium aggregatum]MBD1549207.1 hypothetical protein [Roseibium aggregatum]
MVGRNYRNTCLFASSIEGGMTAFARMMRTIPLTVGIFATLVLSCLAAVVPARASSNLDLRLERLQTEDLEDLFAFVTGNVLFALYHEGGHMLVSELGLPVPDQEEDAVDNLATVTMLSVKDADMDLWLSNAMIGWFLIADGKVGDIPFYTEHNLDLQRAYRMLCLMAGTDEGSFGQLATDLGLPAERRAHCADVSQQAWQSWQTAIGSRLRNSDKPAGKISIYYRMVPQDLASMEIFLKESGLLELIAEDFDTLYTLPDKVTFTARPCGEENAYWDPDKRELTLCYELMAGFARIYLDQVAADK